MKSIFLYGDDNAWPLYKDMTHGCEEHKIGVVIANVDDIVDGTIIYITKRNGRLKCGTRLCGGSLAVPSFPTRQDLISLQTPYGSIYLTFNPNVGVDSGVITADAK
jgi:hypothetical protein